MAYGKAFSGDIPTLLKAEGQDEIINDRPQTGETFPFRRRNDAGFSKRIGRAGLV